MKLLYFSWLRAKIGLAEEDISLPDHIRTVGELVAWLSERGDGHADALSKPEAIRAAVNQAYAEFDHPIRDSDEIAFFPPVTGG